MNNITPAESIADLVSLVASGALGVEPAQLPVVGAFWVRQSTRFPGTQQKYRNHYLLLRVGAVFGGCCVESDDLDPSIAEELSGQSVAELLRDARLPVRIAALDAYMGTVFPHKVANAAVLSLPHGSPLERARVRDEAIAGLLSIQAGQRVALIGVVNPLVKAIEQRGGQCLPCDFNMQRTEGGLEVQRDMSAVVEQADFIVATGMTLSNGSFDRILAVARRRRIPCVIYAQTGSAIAPYFLGRGVTAVSAEPFPFSQFSAEPTHLYLYRATPQAA